MEGIKVVDHVQCTVPTERLCLQIHMVIVMRMVGYCYSTWLLTTYQSTTINRAYPENTNFDTFVPRNLKFHTSGDPTQLRNAENFNLISQIVYEL